MHLQLTRRRLARNIFLGVSAVSLAGAGVSGWLFAARPMDMVLLQLVFYGCWTCFFGARVGGCFGAMMEEDCCSELDMGVLSSMGSMIGTLSAGLVGTALVGLGLATMPWWALWTAAVVVAVVLAGLGYLRPLRVQRLPKVGEMPGVERVEVDLEGGTVRVAWGEGFEGIEAVGRRIDRLGYQVEAS
jgi:hypothetical protein